MQIYANRGNYIAFLAAFGGVSKFCPGLYSVVLLVFVRLLLDGSNVIYKLMSFPCQSSAEKNTLQQ